MIDRCLNPACRAEFKLLDSGSLYAHERRRANTEFFWLCAQCTPQYDLYLDPQGAVAICLRNAQPHGHPPLPEGSLRLVARRTRSALRMPWHATTPAGETRISSVCGFGLGPFAASNEAP
jgi:hypothetical protein